MPRQWFVFAVVSFLSPLMLFMPAGAAEAAGRLKLSTERVVIFKDGHGLVVKAAVATADADGRAYTPEVPDGATLGCFWAVGHDKKVLAMRAEWDEKKEVREKETPAVTVAELLRANLGKVVSLEMTDKTDKGAPLTHDGQVTEMLELPPEVGPAVGASHQPEDLEASTTGPIVYSTMIHDGVAASGSFTAEAIAAGGTLVRELVPRGGEYVVISQEAGRRLVLPVSRVGSVSGGKDFATSITRGEEVLTRSKRLSFDFGKDAAGKPVSLTLFYFTAGLRWVPTYRVSGELKDKADLALQGEILNDVTDIDHAALDLVVGVPNFRFKDNLSPLTLEQTLRRLAIESPANNAYNSQMSNANFDNNRLVAVPAAGAGGAAVPELANAAGEQDLFVYNLKDFSLRKGARATVPLWEQPANLRHLYTYDIHARRSRIGGGLIDESAVNPNLAQSPLQISMNQVWHQLELSNTGAVPWTTGAALMLRDTLPIGQDLLTYTPPSSKALLPVTVAVDLRGTHDDQELDRKANALHFDGQDFMLVRKKGTITVTSFRKEKSDMRITISTGGKVTTASDDGKIKINDFRAGDWDEPAYMRVNNHSDVVWEFTIDPGTTRTITYEVTFFVR